MPAASTLLRRACLAATIALSGAAAFAVQSATAQPAATPAAAAEAGVGLPAALQDLDAYVERVCTPAEPAARPQRLDYRRYAGYEHAQVMETYSPMFADAIAVRAFW